MALQNLTEILNQAKVAKTKRIAVVAADDESVLLSIKSAFELKLVNPILIGNTERIEKLSNSIQFDVSSLEILDIDDPVKASQMAVNLVHSNEADIIMKGLLPTSTLMRIIVKRENRLIKDNLLSHFAISQLPAYSKLLAFTDAAMNICPDLKDKVQIIKNGVKILNLLGNNRPKVAIICPLEFVNPKIESSIHAFKLKVMNQQNLIDNCIIDGPLALDNAISYEAARHKGLISEVAGDADLLVMPDLDAGNILYKSINFLAGGTTAAIITGAKVPIVLTSRADNHISKLNSIALAVCF